MPQSRIRLSHQECFTNNSHVRVLHQILPSSELHSHEFFEIEIILSGSGTHIMNSRSYPLHRGMIWLSTPADFHEIILDGEAEYWTIIFDETMLSQEQMQTLFQSNNTCKVVNEDVLRRLDTAAQLVYEEHLCDGNLRPLMQYLLDAVIPQKSLFQSDDPVHQAILYTETFFRNNPSLATVADHVGLSPNYFGNLFKKKTGETYVSYLNRRKVTCAMMLLESGVSVSTACFESGFGSLSGFLQSFKKVTGMSPNEYQKKRAAKKS